MGNFDLNQEERTVDITKYLTKDDGDLAEGSSKMIDCVCPICALQIKASDERILADHVNRCLLMMVRLRFMTDCYLYFIRTTLQSRRHLKSERKSEEKLILHRYQKRIVKSQLRLSSGATRKRMSLLNHRLSSLTM